MKRTTEAFNPHCLQCHREMDEGAAVRSNTWYKGMVGTRAKLCSETCRERFDAENLSHLTDTVDA